MDYDKIFTHITAIIAILAVAGLVMFALSRGIDGVYLATGLAILAGLGGYKIGGVGVDKIQ